MNRPQRPQPPSAGYDHSVYLGSYADYNEQMKRYSVELLEYAVSLQEAATKREERSRTHVEASER